MTTNELVLPRNERLIKILCLPLIAWHIVQLGLELIGLPGFIQRLNTLSIQHYLYGTLEPLTNQVVMQSAAERGMSIPVYAIYYVVFNTILAIFYAALAGLILWKARSLAFGWFAATVLLFLSPYPLVEVLRQSQLLPPGLVEASSVSWPLVLLFFFVYPNGQVQPRWAVWPVGILLAVHMVAQVFGFLAGIYPALSEEWGLVLNLGTIAISANFVLILGCQVYRYLRVSSPVERQQTKVFLVGLSLMIAIGTLQDFINPKAFMAEISALSLVIVPLAVAVSILRYRLWDIDLIMRRTLVYTILTAALGLVFFGGVTLLQWLFTSSSGQQSPAVIVISTLIIAALFSPLRRRVQEFIDRRFYRQKYDAANAIESFTTTVRNQLEFDNLTSQLVNVVEETIQPESISLWLRKDG